jgi:hypothetical protein
MADNKIYEIVLEHVNEAFPETLVEEVGLPSELFEAMKEFLVETTVKLQDDLLEEYQDSLEMGYGLLMTQIFDDMTRGLTLTQKDKLYRLQERIHLVSDQPFQEYKEELQNLIDVVAPPKAPPKSTTLNDPFENYVPDQERRRVSTDPEMKQYLAVANRIGKLRNHD